MTTESRTIARSRAVCLIAVVLVICLGLASRKIPGLFPACLGKYPGDALWACMMYFLFCLVFPNTKPFHFFILSLAVSCVVEFAKFYKSPWIENLRHTTVGHLIFGITFSWQNLAAYAAGSVLALILDILTLKQPKN